jgi:signal transduction histidine kinase
LATHESGRVSAPRGASADSAFNLREALDMHPDSVFGIDRNWVISYVNAAAVELIGDGNRLVGEDYWSCFSDAGRAGSPSWDHFHKAMQDGVPAEFVEFYPETPHGWTRVTVRRASAGIVVFFHDISVEKHAMEALEQGEKLASLGRLSSSIAHELCNALEAISNLVYLARFDAAVPNHESYLSLAEKEVRRASVIAVQTLGFARPKTTPALVSCDELVKDVLSLHKARIAGARIETDTYALGPAQVLCCEGDVRQILNNLIANAIEAMPAEGGRLVLRSRVSTRKPGRGVLVTVADTGVGMSQQTLAKSFAPFFTTKGEKGNGLGLWISREIAGRHGYTLKAKSSQRRGHTGSVFQLFLSPELIAPFHAHPPEAA